MSPLFFGHDCFCCCPVAQLLWRIQSIRYFSLAAHASRAFRTQPRSHCTHLFLLQHVVVVSPPPVDAAEWPDRSLQTTVTYAQAAMAVASAEVTCAGL